MVYNVGVSCAGTRRFVLASMQTKMQQIHSILDLGCGVGMYGMMVRNYMPPSCRLIGVDGYLPYLESEYPRKYYNSLIWADLFEVVEGRISVEQDCVLCMDVIEHFEKDRARRLSDWLLKQPLAYLSTPLFWFEQDAVRGNELEKHRSGFFFEELTSWGWKPLAKVRWDARGWIGSFKNVD